MDGTQLLDQLSGSSTGGSASDTLQSLQGVLQAGFWVGLVLSVIVTILFVFYLIHKMRVQSAILRIDKNLQKLVDFQIPAPEKVSEPRHDDTPTRKESPDDVLEQK